MKKTYVLWYLILTGFLVGIAYADYFAFAGTRTVAIVLLFGSGISMIYRPVIEAIKGFVG